MAQVVTNVFASVTATGIPPPATGTTLQDIVNMMFLTPLTGGFGTHPVPLQITNTSADWRTHARFGPTPYSTTNPAFPGYNFQWHNAWWQIGRATGYTDTAILQCSVELECPQVWHRKDGGAFFRAKTNPNTGSPQNIDGSVAVLGDPSGGYWATEKANGTPYFDKVTDLSSSTRTRFLAGSDEYGPHGDGHRIKLAGIVRPDGSVPHPGDAEVVHCFYSDAFFPRVKWPLNSDGTPGEVLTYSRARLVGPAGVDLRKVAVECALSGDLYETSTQSTVGTSPAKNPPYAQPVHRWLVDPSAASAVTVHSPWVPMGGLFEVPQANIATIHAATPIPVVTA